MFRCECHFIKSLNSSTISLPYLSFYGFHFSKKAYEYACEGLYKTTQGQMVAVEAYSKDEVDGMLKKHGIELDNKILYDYVYVATMGKADYLGSSIPDEAHLAKFVKDYVDDADATSETPFRRWLATEVGNGRPVEFRDLLDND